ncbi:hypothetical protein J1N35_041776 [Gossypium stocksii]|uniref:MULE transposase domain-containing protein n=1 Tax=Gossypium stocksii TaxID=47602 RepID=A0A9D3ZJQ4_9ROSI|nr:hypothetical protein J1N35_041776 [Gossypium stocksii]
MQWVQNTIFSLGYIIVTRRSKAKENGVVSYVTLICDRGGEYKFKESSKKSGTKKTNCKFRLEQDENNVSTLKTIYNAQQKLRSSQNVGKTPIQIVGVTSTNKTFSIAFAFIINEKEENYNWALTCLKLTLEECMYPRVIVTDRELALMNACQQAFPDATRQNLPCFGLLRGFVALEALDILEGELQRSSRHNLTLQIVVVNYVIVVVTIRECIPLDSIDVFWKKLDLSWSTSMENEDICCDSELEMFKENFTKQSKAGKKNVRGDGNCGFRTISVCVGYGEDQWLYVRHQLLDELLSSYDVYARVFIDGIDELRNSLCFSQSPAPAEHWMVMPMTGVLIANRFGVILNYLTKRGDITFFPLWRGPEHFQYHHAITIAHVYDNHNVMVQLEGDYPMPTISAYWIRHKAPSTAGWQTMYMSRLEFYKQLKHCNLKTPVITIEDYC